MATNFRVKMDGISQFAYIRCFSIPKQNGMSHFWFQSIHWR